MPKEFVLKEHMSSDELRTRWQNARHSVERRRWHALFLVSLGYSGAEVGRLLQRSRSWVSKLVLEYNAFGLEWSKWNRRRQVGRKLELTCPELTVIQVHLRAYRKQFRRSGIRHKIKIKALAYDLEEVTGRLRPESTVRRYAKLVAHVLDVAECVPGTKPHQAPTAKQVDELTALLGQCLEEPVEAWQ